MSREEMTRALDGLASSTLEGRLGQVLFAHARIRAQASSALAFTASRLSEGASAFPASRVHPDLQEGRRERGVPARQAEGLAARVVGLLVAGSDVGHIAALYEVPELAVRTALRGVADHPEASEPLASSLRLLADGRTLAEVAEELKISEERVTTALQDLLPSPLEQRLSHVLGASVAVRSVVPSAPALPFPPGLTLGGSLGAGEQQMVPVRFPEPQYRRLKEWCAEHGFSMAVVVRGLVERFLDDQDRRAA